MKIRHRETGIEKDAVIERLTKKEMTAIKAKSRFGFAWSIEKGKEYYKLRMADNNTALGLMCLIDHPEEGFQSIEIDLLEVSKENVGRKKEWQNIGGCLFAFACRESFKRGYDGCVFLIPKTELIEHYTGYYGFELVPLKTIARPEGFMVLYESGALRLIRKYLENH